MSNKQNVGNVVDKENDPAILTADQLDMASIDKRIKLLQLKREEEDFNKKAEEKDAIERFRVARKAEVEQANQREAAQQSACIHRKRDNTANIGGQKDHQGHRHYICLNCNKHWVDGQLPMELAQNFDPDRMGGPIS